MKIGLDARTMSAPRPRGTGRNLLDAFRLIPGMRPQWHFTLYHQESLAANAALAGVSFQRPNVRLRRLELPGDRIGAWFHVRLPLAARCDRLDLLHLPANTGPLWCPVPAVLTVHDLIPLQLPDEATARQRRAFRRGVQRGIRAARHLITPSEATAEAVVGEFGVPRERITVIPWAADQRIAQAAARGLDAAERLHLRTRHRLAERWLLSFSGRSPRKNAAGVLGGFAQVPVALRANLHLVLVGCEPESRRAELGRLASDLGIGGAVRILGFVPHADLPALLGGAAGLLMPSRAEGFGLPILDAFACGVPVLTSRRSSMPEVAGNAAAYCDPDDARSIAAGIARLLDPVAARVLTEAGRTRLESFSWQRTAEAMCAVYERCGPKRATIRHRARARGSAMTAEMG